MQSEIDDIRLSCKVLEILNSSEKGLTREDITDGIRSIREAVDLIEAQQVVNLPVMTLATIARAAVRERLSQGRPKLSVIDGGSNASGGI